MTLEKSQPSRCPGLIESVYGFLTELLEEKSGNENFSKIERIKARQ